MSSPLLWHYSALLHLLQFFVNRLTLERCDFTTNVIWENTKRNFFADFKLPTKIQIFRFTRTDAEVPESDTTRVGSTSRKWFLNSSFLVKKNHYSYMMKIGHSYRLSYLNLCKSSHLRDVVQFLKSKYNVVFYGRPFLILPKSLNLVGSCEWNLLPAINQTFNHCYFSDLTDCELKPYVSYRTKEIYQEPLTAKDLFNAIYGHKMLRDFKEEKLDENGCSLEPSEEEKLTTDDAWWEWQINRMKNLLSEFDFLSLGFFGFINIKLY